MDYLKIALSVGADSFKPLPGEKIEIRCDADLQTVEMGHDAKELVERVMQRYPNAVIHSSKTASAKNNFNEVVFSL